MALKYIVASIGLHAGSPGYSAFYQMGFKKQLAYIEHEIIAICERFKSSDPDVMLIVAWQEYALKSGLEDRSISLDDKRLLKKLMTSLCQQYTNLIIVAGTVATRRRVFSEEKLAKLMSGYERHRWVKEGFEHGYDEQMLTHEAKAKNLIKLVKQNYTFIVLDRSPLFSSMVANNIYLYRDKEGDCAYTVLNPGNTGRTGKLRQEQFIASDHERGEFYFTCLNAQINDGSSQLAEELQAMLLKILADRGHIFIRDEGIQIIRNSCYIFSNDLVVRHDKISPYCETIFLADELASVFRPAATENSSGSIFEFEHSNTGSKFTIAVEICREHGVGVLSRSNQPVTIHLVLSDTIPLEASNLAGIWNIQFDSRWMPQIISADPDHDTSIELYRTNLIDKVDLFIFHGSKPLCQEDIEYAGIGANAVILYADGGDFKASVVLNGGLSDYVKDLALEEHSIEFLRSILQATSCERNKFLKVETISSTDKIANQIVTAQGLVDCQHLSIKIKELINLILASLDSDVFAALITRSYVDIIGPLEHLSLLELLILKK
jgi:hypothetical protein